MTDKAKSILINGVTVALLAIALIWGTTWYRQWSQLKTGEAALTKGDYMAAIAGFDAAIHMYTPGSPFVGQAASRLWDTAETLEQQGDRDRALAAYRALRSAFYATRWLRTPGRDWIARCDAKIDALVRQKGSGAEPR